MRPSHIAGLHLVHACNSFNNVKCSISTVMDTDVELAKGEGCETSPGCSGYSSMVHSKKVIKHALRQQVKRRRKNTTIAAGNSRTLPRIVVKPLPPPPPNDPPSPVNNVQHANTVVEEPAATMREVLASLPGFSLKSGRRRSTKRLSATAQLEAGLVDLESPASILASTSLRALLNRHTFQGLPPLYQRKLAQLLPAVDRQDAATSGLNNEFFARACLEWRKRLAEGEFTPENQQRLKMEAERDKNKLDPWKVKHFEPIWGEKREPKLRAGVHCITESRSSGAVTRSSLRLRLDSAMEVPALDQTSCPLINSEDKVLDDLCKVEATTNNSEYSNESSALHEELLPKPLDNTNLLLEEKHADSPPSNAVDTEAEVHLETVELEDKLDAVHEKIEPAESNELINQVPEETVATAFPKETHVHLSEQSAELLDNNMPEVLTDDAVPLHQKLSPTDSDQAEQSSQLSEQTLSQLSEECASQASEEQLPIAKDRMSQIADDPLYQIPDCEAGILETSPDQVRTTEIVMEDPTLINNPVDANPVDHVNAPDGEAQIPEGMEIDSETLQRIHELEVRGEMREAYEEISGCPEEIMYPILEGMEIGTTSTEESEPQVVAGPPEAVPDQQDINAGTEDEALRDANNYVCSEMLECSWSVDSAVNSISNNSTSNNSRAQEDLQVPWPLVAAALDGSVAANITVTTQDECSNAPSTADSTNPPQQFINADASVESVNCIQLPVVQGSSFPSEGLGVSAPAGNCVMKNFPSPSQPLIAFPQLQSIRFVQTNFNSDQSAAALSTASAIPAQLHNQAAPNSQINVMTAPEDVVPLSARSGARNNVAPTQPQSAVPAAIGMAAQSRAPNTIVIQHQTPTPAPARQVVTAIHQPQQYPGAAVAFSSRSSRSTNPGSQRSSRNNNKEQGSGRSRGSTKEPPGAVNLERSYQICQAVIQSSPNRDQLKAHLKPPPSLLARSDGAFTASKSGGRTVTTVKTQKPVQTVQHSKQAQNKTQAVMLRHVFATARQAASAEIPESNTVAQLGSTSAGGLGQYILVQRTGVGDGAPRASSAPPIPPQIAGMGVGVHLVRGRPASAGEGSHQAVTLKARGNDGRGAGGAEPGAPGMIMGSDPPPPCECNMRGAMVICRQCGAFCHDDCIGPQRICATCLIR